jgi:hypothetical protein
VRTSSTKTPAIVLLASSAAVLAACASGGGMYDQPYALFETELASVPADTRAAYIQQIDSEQRAINANDPVAPGVRKVVLSVPGPRALGNDSRRQTLTVDAKPCMRYYFAARRPSASSDDWSAYVVYSEPIGECRKKFPAAG